MKQVPGFRANRIRCVSTALTVTLLVTLRIETPCAASGASPSHEHHESDCGVSFRERDLVPLSWRDDRRARPWLACLMRADRSRRMRTAAIRISRSNPIEMLAVGVRSNDWVETDPARSAYSLTSSSASTS
jgi:hypothetical protein